MRDAPFDPLIAAGGGLRRRQGDMAALRRRMAEIYGVDEENIFPVRGRTHAIEVALRWVARLGGGVFSTEDSPYLRCLAELYGVPFVQEAEARAGFYPLGEAGPDPADGRLKIVDESDVEFARVSSCVSEAVNCENVAVIRSLEATYGLAGAPCGALIANKGLIERLATFVEPDAVPRIICDTALAALDPQRMAATSARIALVKEERARIANALSGSTAVMQASEEFDASVSVQFYDEDAAARRLAEFGLKSERMANDQLRLPIGTVEENDRLLAAFDVRGKTRARRFGEAVRETYETKIVATVDLDREGVCDIKTGVGFFDHMLSQIVHHAGVSATLACNGDLEVDAHHTIEDCALAFGQALASALGDRRGIARFGFLLPMDEAEAKVSIDLGERPYLVFNGNFSAPLIGEYPVEMTEHVFQSLAQSLGAAIHLSVTGDNDHHKTEACFKAFGRALRQALRVEGETTPSTKGSIL